MARKLADVAKQAGVSEATVSRVLNGKPGISDATRAAVLTALDVMGYERPTHLRVRRARVNVVRSPRAFVRVVSFWLASYSCVVA